MRSYFSSYLTAHAMAVIGAVALHTGIAGLVMQPDPPVVIPQSQIIQVSMVAPTIIKQDKIKPELKIKKKTQTMTPPAPKGMVKQEPERPPQPEKILKKKSEIQQLTSGISQENATKMASVLTKPLAAAYLNNPPPRYPEKSRLRKQEGTVLLDIKVQANGKPKNVSILRSSGYTLLDQAALEAVRQWIFVPARRGSNNIEANVEVPVKFQIK